MDFVGQSLQILDDTDGQARPTLRGDALDGPERKGAADHAVYKGKRNPDRVVRVDGEEDTLYKDGLDLEDDDSPPMGTSSTP